MPYRKAFSTLGAPEFTLEQALALARRHRLDAIEVRALAGGLEVPAVLAEAYGTPEALARRLADETVRIAAFDTSLRLVGSSEEERGRLLGFVPWAEALGVRWLRVFDGGREADAAEIAGAAATIGWWRAERARHGWRTDLMVETHDSLFTAEKIGRFLRAAPRTAILWDTHHTWRHGGEDPIATWSAIVADVVHVHVKDSVSRPGPKHPYTYVPPGEGEFPAGPLLERLRGEFDGVVSLEWEKLWHPDLASLEDALAAALRHNWL